MEGLIKTINQIQEVCSTVKGLPRAIDLPQIVVVGGQSSGKSSVIESIVRREFLPRGTGIVTRRPLIIQLVKSADSDDIIKFEHTDKIYVDFDKVREEIEEETERVCGNNKGICSKPIIITLYSRNVIDLTLVDLPGLVKNPIGDQPADIEIQIRDLVMEYINNTNSIILAVTPANTDYAVSEAIKLAREVDPEGRRTLAVFTKLDIMDRGTNALDVLSGSVIKIRLGIVGVVNRSQQDIINKKSLDAAIEYEAQFLQQHYPSVSERNGTPYLTKRLSQVLMRHIRECLPDLKLRIDTLTAHYQAQLNSYGEPVTDKNKTILDAITKFSQKYCDALKGGYRQQIDASELCGGARIQYILRETLNRALSDINPLENLSNMHILTFARNVAGLDTSISVPLVFKLLVSHQIKRLANPCLRCVDLVHEEMSGLVQQFGDVHLLRFPKLHKKIEEIVTMMLSERLPITKKAVEDIVRWCSKFIDAEDPRLREVPLLEDEDITNDSAPRTERDLRKCPLIAKKIAAYFNIIREEVKVFVPRAIMDSMVDPIEEKLQSQLIEELYHSAFDDLLTESEEIARRRKETVEMLAGLKRASEIINVKKNPKIY